MSDVLALMQKHAKAFKAAEVPDRTPLPDSNYQFKLYKTPGKAIIVKDSDGAWRARIGLEVASAEDPKCIGKKTTKSWNLFGADETPDEKGFSYLKGDLKIMGVDAEDLELPQLGDALESLIDTIVDAQVKTSKDKNDNDRQNVWLRGTAAKAPKGAKPGTKPAKKF